MNSAEKSCEVAASVADDLVAENDIDAVLLGGSAALGYADKHSDIDLRLLGSIGAGERSVGGIHVEWTSTTYREIGCVLSDWNDDAALYTYANADILYDQIGISRLLAAYQEYPHDIWKEKLYTGWYYGTGDLYDAQKAISRDNRRVMHCATALAVEQFAALSYILSDRFPPYQKWLFQDIPHELPELDEALRGDIDALDELSGRFESELREILDDERIEKPYLHEPQFERLG